MDKNKKIDSLEERLSILNQQMNDLDRCMEKIQERILYCKKTKTLFENLEEGVKIKAKIDFLAIYRKLITAKIKQKDQELKENKNG